MKRMVVVPVIAMSLVGVVASVAWLAPHQESPRRSTSTRCVRSHSPRSGRGGPWGLCRCARMLGSIWCPCSRCRSAPVTRPVCSYDQQGKPLRAVQLDGARTAELAGVIDNPKVANPEVGTLGQLTPNSVVVVMTYAEGDPAKLVITQQVPCRTASSTTLRARTSPSRCAGSCADGSALRGGVIGPAGDEFGDLAKTRLGCWWMIRQHPSADITVQI